MMLLLCMFAGITLVNAQTQRISAIDFHTYATAMGEAFTGTDNMPDVIQQNEVINPAPDFVYVEPDQLSNADYACKEEVKQEEIVAGVIQEELNAGRKADQTNGLLNLLHTFSTKNKRMVDVLNAGRHL